MNYNKLVYKILSHYRIMYNYSYDLEEDYYHEGILALTIAYNTYKEDSGVKFITYASNCIHNRYRDIFKKKHFCTESLDMEIKDDLFMLDIIPLKEERILDKIIREETKKELKDSINNLSNEDKFIISSLYGIETRKITQKKLAKQLNCTQSCIAKKHSKILNLIKEDLKY